ncbi:MAG: hypothetical protein SGILL_006402, partial [Bacillariaceae sp.]
MHPGDTSFSKRSLVLGAWSGVLALGFGGIVAWMRALRNERKLFHLAKMEYERNRQQQESNMDNQKVEITKHLKRAAASGAAVIAQKKQYKKALDELDEKKQAVEEMNMDRANMCTNPTGSSSLAENERAWSKQLYNAMDIEAFTVAEKAMEKRWKELDSWGVQIEQMRNRNSVQKENLRAFRESREERIKDEFDHFEGERERLVRLAQELEALKMDVEEYKEETRVKEEQRSGELNAKEEELQKKDLDLKSREEGVFDKFYEPITLLVSPPTAIDEVMPQVEKMESAAEKSIDSQVDESQDQKETTAHSRSASSHLGRQLEAADSPLQIEDILKAATQSLGVRRKASSRENSKHSRNGSNSPVKADDGTKPVDTKAQDVEADMAEDLDEDKEMISHDDDEDEDEANEIDSVAVNEESSKHDAVTPTKDDTVKSTEGECVEDLVEIFKSGSEREISITQHSTMESSHAVALAPAAQGEASLEEGVPRSVSSSDPSSPSDEEPDDKDEPRTIHEENANPVADIDGQHAAQNGTQEEDAPKEASGSSQADSIVDPEQSVPTETEPSQAAAADMDISERSDAGSIVPFVGDVAESMFKSAIAALFQPQNEEEPPEQNFQLKEEDLPDQEDPVAPVE